MMGARLLVGSLAAAGLSASVGAEATDPYVALKVMDGHWVATASNGHTRAIDNHCARTGVFFECEQSVNGKAAALVVFLPQQSGRRGLAYRVQTLTAAGDRPGPWRDLLIDKDRWTYGEAVRSPGHGRAELTIDTYSGPDFMHVEVEAQGNRGTWTTVSSGDLTRAH